MSAAAGLTAEEADRLLGVHGPNELPSERPPRWWKALLAQLTHFFALLLWGAGLLAFVAGLPQLGIAIFVVVVVNALFAFAQEHRAERAARQLRALLPRRAVVVRDGHRTTLDAVALVPGDLVLLEPGDRISADLVLGDSHELAVDTSTFTGESVPTQPSAGAALWAGTAVLEGEGSGVVTATGSRTRLADVARLARGRHRPASPLHRELHRVVVVIARIAVGVGVAFFGLASLLGVDLTDGFVFAIGVTVALVPEGMLPTVTLSLAVGAQRMAAEHALVRRLDAVETLGSTTFICTDKTGTLTENRMVAVAAWTPAGGARVEGPGYGPEATVDIDPGAAASVTRLAGAAFLASSGRAARTPSGWVAEGDPIDAALDALRRRLGRAGIAPGLDTWDAAHRQVERAFAFDPVRRRRSVVCDGELLVKGAPESILACCWDGLVVRAAHQALDELTGEGLRVIAVASRALDEPAGAASAVEVEVHLDLLGLVAFEDPVRASARDALARCRQAGIRVAMITGDHPATAAGVARQAGLALEGSPVIDGSELPERDEELAGLVDHDGVVVARVAPEGKLRIARALQGAGHVVAMTGDGVNDAPALRQADIGVAMGRSGTDVAREAADLVLLDDEFGTIVDAVATGRAVFSNVRRFLTYHLTDNVAELTPFVVWALSGGTVPLALGVLQILFLDIGTDLLPALALGAEPPDERALDRPPSSGRLLDRAVARRVFGVLGPVEATFEMAAFFAVFAMAGWRPGDDFPGGATLAAASGAAFTTVVLAQLANALACRSETRPAWSTGVRGNRLLVPAMLVELVALAVFVFVAPVADLLGHAPPTLVGWVLAVAAAPGLLLVDGFDKRRRARRLARRVVSP